jgi:hypothetical protein
MNNLPETSMKTNVEIQNYQVPWWSRPIWGENSLLEALWKKFQKQQIPESTVFLHNRELMDVKVFAKTAIAIDSDKFSNAEFLQYVRLKCYLARGIGEYAGLNESVQLLQVAIEAKNSYITLDQTELRYRSLKQQELYNYVIELLEVEQDKNRFREKVQEKLTEILSYIKTEEGRTAMQSYAEELDHLAEHELGLKLLALFKAYQLADYSILRTISELVASLKEEDVNDLKSLNSLVMSKYNIFDKLGQIIGVKGKQHRPETYARMIQFIALTYRHGLSYLKFDELINVMRKWFKPYNAIIGIRGEYSSMQYKLPAEFCEEIPGVDIYEKYKKSLTDQNTGYAFISFESE